jgi:CTP synthase
VKELRSIGIQPDILLCRTDRPIPKDMKAKIALFCNVTEDAVITATDVDCIYEVPLIYHNEGLDDKLMELLNIWAGEPRLDEWTRVVDRWRNPVGEVTIAIVGKYVNLKESYKSLNEALTHGGIAHQLRVHHRYVDSEEVERQGPEALLKGADGILVPGGFGSRGVEGKIAAVRYARENEIPFFGICLGMQVAVVEFARSVCGLADATSRELDTGSRCPVIDLMPEQRDVEDKGATMRLGAYPCRLQEKSLARKAYGAAQISERHRHRYEFNNDYREMFAGKGMAITGVSPDDRLVEIVEVPGHPWFLGCQFHPEFQSRPLAPHPLFRDFIGAARVRSSRKGDS